MQPSPSPITLKADLFLVHAPSVFDFRERDDVFFAYLSDSDSVNITSVFEMFPIGLLSIKQRLLEDHITAEIVNLASLMLMHPTLDVDALLRRMDAPVFGIDLHWMAHCHGAIEVAKRMLHEIDTTLAQDGQLPQSLKDEIRAYNRKILAYSSDQIIPLSRPFGGRWFDDFTVPSALIQELSGVRAPAIEI